MKYLLSFFIVALSVACRAQTAAITVTNINPVCTAYVNLYAADIPNGNPSCGIVSNTVMLPPSGSLVAGSWTALMGMLNFTAPVPVATTTFYWSDITFQWYCPSPPCGPSLSWGVMSDPVAGPTCYGALTTWTGFGCTAGTSTWTNIPFLPFMANIRVVLN